MQQSNHQIRVEKKLVDGKPVLQLVLETCEIHGLPFLPGFDSTNHTTILDEVSWDADEVVLSAKIEGMDYTLSYGTIPEGKPGCDMKEFAVKADARLLNGEDVGPMVGTLLGMFATGNGVASENEAAFEYFTYRRM